MAVDALAHCNRGEACVVTCLRSPAQPDLSVSSTQLPPAASVSCLFILFRGRGTVASGDEGDITGDISA